MKKIISKRKRNKVKEEALKQFRQTRKKLKSDHPELLEKIRKLYLEREQAQQAMESAQEHANTSEYYVDKNKTIETVIKFLESSHSKDFQKRVRTLLSSAIH